MRTNRRANGSIPVSRKHGVNPSMPTCFFCGQKKNEIILFGRLRGDAEAPMYCGVVNMDPCEECAEHMKAGIILISVRDGEANNNPYRTGGWWVVKDDALRRIVNDPEVAEHILQLRWSFIPDSVCKMIGLTLESQEQEP